MNAARRRFLASTSAFTCAVFSRQVALGKSLLAAPFPAANRELYGRALIAKMKWFNEPASARQSGDQLVVTTKPKTDYWRKTFYDYVTDNGHFLFLSVAGDFTLQSRVVGKYAALYDQAGLMVRIDNSNWLKCGLDGHHVLLSRRCGLRCYLRRAPPNAMIYRQTTRRENRHAKIPWAIWGSRLSGHPVCDRRLVCMSWCAETVWSSWRPTGTA